MVGQQIGWVGGSPAETGGQPPGDGGHTWPPALPGRARPSSCFRSSSSRFRESSMPVGRASRGGGGGGQHTKPSAGWRAATFGWRHPGGLGPPLGRLSAARLLDKRSEGRAGPAEGRRAATYLKTSAGAPHRRWPFLRSVGGRFECDRKASWAQARRNARGRASALPRPAAPGCQSGMRTQ